MVRFIVVTFAVLGWAFFQMSGGSDFEPRSARAGSVEVQPLQAANQAAPQTPAGAEVTRVALDLTSVQEVVRESRSTQRNARVENAVAAATQPSAAGQWQTLDTLPSLVQDAQIDTSDAIAEVLQTASLVGNTDTDVASASDLRRVNGNRVNVRGGPGTNFGVVGKLVRGDEVEVLEDNGSGWVRFRQVDGSTTGWLADFLLADS